jgi:hypothetical protein
VEGYQKKSHSLIMKRLRNGRTIQASSCSWKAHNEALRNDREYGDTPGEDYYDDNEVVEDGNEAVPNDREYGDTPEDYANEVGENQNDHENPEGGGDRSHVVVVAADQSGSSMA